MIHFLLPPFQLEIMVIVGGTLSGRKVLPALDAHATAGAGNCPGCAPTDAELDMLAQVEELQTLTYMHHSSLCLGEGSEIRFPFTWFNP